MMKERKVRRTRKFVGTIGVLVTVASLTACGSGSNEAKEINKEVSKIEAIQEPTATPEENNVSMDFIVLATKIAYEKSFDYCDVSYDSERDALVLNISKSGIGVVATKSKNDFNAYKKWVNMTYKFNEQCNGILNTIIRKNGYNDTILLVNIVNDLNKDAVLFSSVDGRTAYDFVQGIDITKQN